MHTRRNLLTNSARVAGMLAALGLLPGPARAEGTPYHGAAFDAHSLADVLKALGAAAPQPSSEVSLAAPDVAENGAAVPVTLASTLPGAQRLLLLVEKNPHVLSALYDLGDAVPAQVSMRVKMNESSNVYAVAILADGRVLYAVKDVKVIAGGCSE